jgi:GntR family transcriptional regulator
MTNKAEKPRLPKSSLSLPLNSQSRSPLYYQIYLILRSQIVDGHYAPGDYLPGERDLEGLFGVSRITAVRALNELANDGLVVRERGRGTRVQFVGEGYVSRGPIDTRENPPPVPRGRTADVFEQLRWSGAAKVTLYDFSYREPPKAIAEILRTPPGEDVQYAERSWEFDKKVFNYVETFVPADIGRNWTREDMTTSSLSELLERSGVKVKLQQEQVTATLADTLLAERLRVGVGSPLLKIRRVAYDAKGRAVEIVTSCYPPDRYLYEVTLPRETSASPRTTTPVRRRNVKRTGG